MLLLVQRLSQDVYHHSKDIKLNYVCMHTHSQRFISTHGDCCQMQIDRLRRQMMYSDSNNSHSNKS